MPADWSYILHRQFFNFSDKKEFQRSVLDLFWNCRTAFVGEFTEYLFIYPFTSAYRGSGLSCSLQKCSQARRRDIWSLCSLCVLLRCQSDHNLLILMQKLFFKLLLDVRAPHLISGNSFVQQPLEEDGTLLHKNIFSSSLLSLPQQMRKSSAWTGIYDISHITVTFWVVRR